MPPMLPLIFQLIAVFLLLINECYSFDGAQGIGVTLAMDFANLPPIGKIVRLCKSKNIERIRLYDANPYILNGLRNSGIRVIVAVLDKDILRMSNDPSFPALWVKTNILPYKGAVTFRCILVGNNLIPSHDLAPEVLPAMQALDNALKAANASVPVTTGFHPNVLKSAFPPAAGVFYPDVLPIVKPILEFLTKNGYPLNWDVDSFWWFTSDPSYANIPLEYALLNNTLDVIVQDGFLEYRNLLEGIVDAMYSALEWVGGEMIELIVGATGWPGGPGEVNINTWSYAQIYSQSLIRWMITEKSTPRRKVWFLEAYLHSLFLQDADSGYHRYYGLFYPNMTEVYPLSFAL